VEQTVHCDLQARRAILPKAVRARAGRLWLPCVLAGPAVLLSACSSQPPPDRSNPFYLSPQAGDAPAASAGSPEGVGPRRRMGVGPGAEPGPLDDGTLPGGNGPGSVEPGSVGAGSVPAGGNPLSGGGSMSFGAGGN